MTHTEHKVRHLKLHTAYDELAADYLRWNPSATLSTTTLMQLMEWSSQQTRNPLEDPRRTVHVVNVCAHCGGSVVELEGHVCTSLEVNGNVE